jgi:hypothetical protein
MDVKALSKLKSFQKSIFGFCDMGFEFNPNLETKDIFKNVNK